MPSGMAVRITRSAHNEREIKMIADNTFAAACYEQNSVLELQLSLRREADKHDCAEWGITPEQWREQIEIALAAKLADRA